MATVQNILLSFFHWFFIHDDESWSHTKYSICGHGSWSHTKYSVFEVSHCQIANILYVLPNIRIFWKIYRIFGKTYKYLVCYQDSWYSTDLFVWVMVMFGIFNMEPWLTPKKIENLVKYLGLLQKLIV